MSSSRKTSNVVFQAKPSFKHLQSVFANQKHQLPWYHGNAHIAQAPCTTTGTEKAVLQTTRSPAPNLKRSTHGTPVLRQYGCKQVSHAPTPLHSCSTDIGTATKRVGVHMNRLSQRGTRHACLSIVFVPVPRGTDRVTGPTSKTVAVRATSNELLLVHRPSSSWSHLCFPAARATPG